MWCGLFINDQVELQHHENNHIQRERMVVIVGGNLLSIYLQNKFMLYVLLMFGSLNETNI